MNKFPALSAYRGVMAGIWEGTEQTLPWSLHSTQCVETEGHCFLPCASLDEGGFSWKASSLQAWLPSSRSFGKGEWVSFGVFLSAPVVGVSGLWALLIPRLWCIGGTKKSQGTCHLIMPQVPGLVYLSELLWANLRVALCIASRSFSCNQKEQ